MPVGGSQGPVKRHLETADMQKVIGTVAFRKKNGKPLVLSKKEQAVFDAVRSANDFHEEGVMVDASAYNSLVNKLTPKKGLSKVAARLAGMVSSVVARIREKVASKSGVTMEDAFKDYTNEQLGKFIAEDRLPSGDAVSLKVLNEEMVRRAEASKERTKELAFCMARELGKMITTAWASEEPNSYPSKKIDEKVEKFLDSHAFKTQSAEDQRGILEVMRGGGRQGKETEGILARLNEKLELDKYMDKDVGRWKLAGLYTAEKVLTEAARSNRLSAPDQQIRSPRGSIVERLTEVRLARLFHPGAKLEKADVLLEEGLLELPLRDLKRSSNKEQRVSVLSRQSGPELVKVVEKNKGKRGKLGNTGALAEELREKYVATEVEALVIGSIKERVSVKSFLKRDLHKASFKELRFAKIVLTKENRKLSKGAVDKLVKGETIEKEVQQLVQIRGKLMEMEQEIEMREKPKSEEGFEAIHAAEKAILAGKPAFQMRETFPVLVGKSIPQLTKTGIPGKEDQFGMSGKDALVKELAREKARVKQLTEETRSGQDERQKIAEDLLDIEVALAYKERSARK